MTKIARGVCRRSPSVDGRREPVRGSRRLRPGRDADLYQAIRANDIGRLKTLVVSPAAANRAADAVRRARR